MGRGNAIDEQRLGLKSRPLSQAVKSICSDLTMRLVEIGDG